MIFWAKGGRSQEGIGGEDDTDDDADVQSLSVGTRAKETQQKDTGDAAGEDGVKGEDDTENSVGPLGPEKNVYVLEREGTAATAKGATQGN